MKLITAYIRPEKLRDVKKALFNADIHKMSVTNALGCGQQGGYTTTYRGIASEVNLLKKVRIDIGLNEEFVDKTVAAIIEGAKTDAIGDGKIFITELQECIRIRTGETGSEAIG